MNFHEWGSESGEHLTQPFAHTQTPDTDVVEATMTEKCIENMSYD